jgi:hypothetical protein
MAYVVGAPGTEDALPTQQRRKDDFKISKLPIFFIGIRYT